MALNVERAGRRDLDDVEAPQALGAEELDKGAAPAEPRPIRERQVLHPAHPDAAVDRNAFGLHEAVVRHRRALELAVAGVLAGLRLVPVHLVGGVVHGSFSSGHAGAATAAARYFRTSSAVSTTPGSYSGA